MTDDTKEIALLFPSGKEITLKGKKVIVKPFGFGKFPKVLQLAKDLKLDNEAPAGADGVAVAKSLDIGTIMAENADKVVDLCALALGVKSDYLDDLPPDEGIELCQAIIEVNADFFIKRLQPKLLTALSGLSGSVGALLLQDSSQPGTGSEISSTTH